MIDLLPIYYQNISPLIIFPHKSFIFELIIIFPYLIELKNTNNYNPQKIKIPFAATKIFLKFNF